MTFEARGVSCGYGATTVVRDVSFSLDSGEVLCLLGPNGVGKTTLFKSLLGFLKPSLGDFLVDGRNVGELSRKKMAQVLAYVPQVHEPPFPFSVLDVVVMGGVSQFGRFSRPTKSSYLKAESILESLEVAHLSGRIYTEISGGERQMVMIARALMQNPRFLVMDEPTSNLDFGNQMRVLRQIQKLAANGVGIMMTSHFPDHAFLCCTKAVLMGKRNPFVVGVVDDVVTEKNLKHAYGVQVSVVQVPDDEFGTVTTCLPRLGSVDVEVL